MKDCNPGLSQVYNCTANINQLHLTVFHNKKREMFPKVASLHVCLFLWTSTDVR